MVRCAEIAEERGSCNRLMTKAGSILADSTIHNICQLASKTMPRDP